MINFGPRESVPDRYSDRLLYHHNPTVTLMRTTRENNLQIGKFIASQLTTHSTSPSKIKVLLPLGGVSMIDAPSQPFHDPDADLELFKALDDGLRDSGIEVQRLPDHVNDEKFAAQVCATLLEVLDVDPRSYRLANARRRKWSFDHGKSINLVRRASEIQIPDTIEA
jgi:uncharacterized protein (UPF0261 family)